MNNATVLVWTPSAVLKPIVGEQVIVLGDKGEQLHITVTDRDPFNYSMWRYP